MYTTSMDNTSSRDRPAHDGPHQAAGHRPAASGRAFLPSGTGALRNWCAVGATMMLAASLSACEARESPTPKTGAGAMMGTLAAAGSSTATPSGSGTNAQAGSNAGPGASRNGDNTGGNATGTSGASAPAHAPPGPPSNPPDITSGTRSPQLPDQTGSSGSRAPAGSGSISGGAGTSGMSGSGAAAGSGGSADERR